jgi:hypothetical protein
MAKYTKSKLVSKTTRKTDLNEEDKTSRSLDLFRKEFTNNPEENRKFRNYVQEHPAGVVDRFEHGTDHEKYFLQNAVLDCINMNAQAMHEGEGDQAWQNTLKEIAHQINVPKKYVDEISTWI